MTKRRIYLFSFLVFLLFLSWGQSRYGSAANEVDQSLYAELLSKYVKNGIVNYQGFKNDEENLDQYLKVLEKTDTKTLSRNEQFAFYVNAYNAWTCLLYTSPSPRDRS